MTRTKILVRGGLEQRIWALFRKRFLPGVWLRYVCNAGYVLIAGTLFGAVVHHSRTEFAETSREITVADRHCVPFVGTNAV